MTRLPRTRRALRRAWDAINAQEPGGALSHPDGGPGPYWPPTPKATPAPRIAPLGQPSRSTRPRPVPVDVPVKRPKVTGLAGYSATQRRAIREAEAILRKARP